MLLGKGCFPARGWENSFILASLVPLRILSVTPMWIRHDIIINTINSLREGYLALSFLNLVSVLPQRMDSVVSRLLLSQIVV